MDTDLLYWAIEYGKVLLAYIAVLFVWPSVVFYGWLKGRSRTVRFAFCVTVPVVLCNTVVLGLGLLHILHGWLVALLFYGVFFWSLWRRFRIPKKEWESLGRVIIGTYGVRLFLSDQRVRFRAWKKEKRAAVRTWVRGHRLEYLTLAVVLVFGMIYFTYGSFQNVCYGASDISVHHSWIYQLLQGTIFYAGVYPEGMHCFVYTLRVVFGIPIYSLLQLLPGAYIAVFLLSVYLFLRELSAWRGTPVLVLALFLTVDVVNANMMVSLARLQWCLPQEFSFYAMFLCPLFLERCLKDDFSDAPRGVKKKLRFCWQNEDLLLFQMAFVVTVVAHFYTTIMTFFLCLAVVLCRFWKVFCKKRWLYLTAAVLCGLFVSVAPMAIAYLEGIPFQGSIGWALSVMQDAETEEEETAGETEESEGTEGAEETDTQTAAESTERVLAETQQETEPVFGTEIQESVGRTGSAQVSFLTRLKEICIEKGKILYEKGYVSLYSAERANIILLAGAAGAAMWLFYRLAAGVLALVWRKKHWNTDFVHRMDGNMVILLTSLILTIECASAALGIPKLMDSIRLSAVEQIFVCAQLLVPLDIAAGILAATPLGAVLCLLIPAGTGGIYALTQYYGVFHGYLFTYLTRYNAEVDTTNRIVDTYPANQYTIVSPTDELYQVIEDGRHEEALTFVKRITGENYTLPTEYVFVYVEKEPFEYVQPHFFVGPDWLAAERYSSFYVGFSSEGNQYLTRSVSEEAAQQELETFARVSQSYTNIDSRTTIESRLYRWCQTFSELYPEDIKVYYEDDRFCCYVMRQNTYRLYRLETR